MKWEDILKISTEDAISDAKRYAAEEVEEGEREATEHKCPNCGSEVKPYSHYLDDYDIIYRCSKAYEEEKFKGKYAKCYPMGDNQDMYKPPKGDER